MQRLKAFHNLLDQTISERWANSNLLSALPEGAQALAENMQSAGDSALQNLTESNPGEETRMADHLIHFEWAEQAKNFLILWRDILFEQQKADLLFRDGKVGSAAIDDLKNRSHKTILEAADALKKFPDKKLTEIRSNRSGEKKRIEAWKLQTNPWSKYREQIGHLAQQCLELEQLHLQLVSVSSTLRDIRLLTDETVIFCQTETNSFKETARQVDAYIEENEHNPGKVATHLEELEADLKMTSYANSFIHFLEEKLNELEEKIQVPVAIDGGLVQQREVSFRRRARQWLESETLPLLYEIWELTERTGNSLKMSLVNIRNRAILLSKSETEISHGRIDLSQPIHIFLRNTEENEVELAKLKELLISRLSKEFELSAIYQPNEFLAIPLQSTIEQMNLDQSPLLVKARDWTQHLSKRLRQVRSDVVQENVLSISEKIVRYVQEYTPDVENSHYSNIFLTKGYIGESFVVGREDELAHVRKIVHNWRLGFRGAIILRGRRFAGKSLFGELVASRHFIGHTIRLAPNAILQVGSRRMTTTTDLGAALSFIEKHTLGERQLVWIDDLELWTDANISLSQNVRRLCRTIDSLSDRLFFLVAMSNWTRDHLDRFHELSRVFQAEVNLDRMSAAEIRQAILIRHGATHRALVDTEGKEITPQQFQRMTELIFKSSRGNVGDALNRWSAATRRVDEERVMHHPGPGNTLPDFLHPDSRILLRTLLLGKRSSEYRLRRIFGPAFKDKYGGILQRLLRTGLLTRQMDGWLEVNEVAVNEVGRMVFGKLKNNR